MAKENAAAGSSNYDDKEGTGRGKSAIDNRHRMYLTSCLYLVGFLDMFGVGMLVPLMSRHARDLGATPALIGAVGSVYGILQLISGPLMGRLSDTMGRRLILLVCLFMTAVGYTINVFATSVEILICSRIPLGIFKHGIATVKAFLAEITPREERPRVFGRFNSASSAGFIVGPLCGGYLADYEGGFYQVAMCTAVIFFINFLFAYCLVHPQRRQTLQKTDSVSAFTREEYAVQTNFLQSFRAVLASSGDLLLLQLLMGFGVMLYRSNFVLGLEERFAVQPSVTGRLISFGSLVGVLSGFAVGRAVALYRSVSRLLLHCGVLLAFTLYGLAVAPSLLAVVLLTAALSLQNAVSRVCLTDLSVRRSRPDQAGVLLGVSQSAASLARSFAPLVSGFLLEWSPHGPGLAGAGFAVAATMMMIILPPERATAAPAAAATTADKKTD